MIVTLLDTTAHSLSPLMNHRQQQQQQQQQSWVREWVSERSVFKEHRKPIIATEMSLINWSIIN